MAIKTTSIRDVFKDKVASETKIPTIWVDFDGVEHQDFEYNIADVLSFSKKDPSDYSSGPGLTACAYIKQVGPHVTKAYRLVHPKITKDFTDFNPEIFKYAFNLELAVECFNNLTKKIEIPSDFFSSCTLLKTANGVFKGCYGLSSIPSELFSNCLGLMDVSNLFTTCVSIDQIPKDLFRNNSMLRTFNNTFSFCPGITEIPSELFEYCPAAESFDGCFSKGSFTHEIPEDLFKYNKKAYDFSRCFSLRNITNPISERLFDYLDLSQPQYLFTALFAMGTSKFSGKNPVDFFKEKVASLGAKVKIAN